MRPLITDRRPLIIDRETIAIVRRPSFAVAVGVGLTTCFVLTAALGAFIPHETTSAINIGARLQPPGGGNFFGTDQYGRDLFLRIASGAPIALGIALGSVALALALGGSIGALAGFYGGWRAEIAMRASDGLQAFPALLLAITVIAALGPGHVNTMLAIGIVGVPTFARLMRASVLLAREQDYALAARSIGGDDAHILRKHILPNVFSPIIVQASIALGNAILAEAGLSYLGLGTQPPQASWGRMLEEARTFWGSAPWMAIFPGSAIAGAILGLNLLGDGLRDWLDPK